MDDETIVRNTIGQMLKHLGYESAFAEDAEEAIRLYEEAMASGTPFDLAIFDLTIPGGKGGTEAMVRILEVDPCARVIVSSGYSNDPVMANFAQYGFSGVISKPYRVQQLGSLLAQILG